MRKRTFARECALQILYQNELNPEELEKTIANFWEQNSNFESEVREFANKLVEGTFQKREELDEVIRKAADNWELSRMAVIDRNILRFATFEMLFMDDIPSKVSINEAVNIAKKFSQEDSGKFVNGVLDKINHSEKPRSR